MAVLNRILPLLPALALTGCYENFSPDVQSAPVLCINAIVTAGDPVEPELSHTWYYTDGSNTTWQNGQNEPDHSVSDATMHIYINGRPMPEGYTAAEGDTIRIVAESRTYGAAEATVTVPHAPAITLEGCTPRATSYGAAGDHQDYAMMDYVMFDLNVELRIDDRANTADYYRFYYEPVSYGANEHGIEVLSRGSFNYDAEPIFSEHIGVFESVTGSDSWGFTFFSDRQFAGDSYTLRLRLTNISYHAISVDYDEQLEHCGFLLTLASVSESYYNWCNYIWQCENGIVGDMGNVGFAPPMPGYSNVSTGAGIVAAQTLSQYYIDLTDFIRHTLASNDSQ